MSITASQLTVVTIPLAAGIRWPPLGWLTGATRSAACPAATDGGNRKERDHDRLWAHQQWHRTQ